MRGSTRGLNESTLTMYDNFCAGLFSKEFQNNKTPISGKRKKMHFFAFAKKIGFEAPVARFIIDCYFATYLPTFKSFSNDAKEVKKITKDFGGMYSVYRFDQNNATQSRGYPHGLIADCRLSVRYPVPSGKHYSVNSQYRMRCKLNIPAYPPITNNLRPKRTRLAQKLYKYDGYVSNVKRNDNNWIQWLFQERSDPLSPNSEDIILMHTEPEPLPLQSEDTFLGQFKFYLGKLSYQDQSESVMPTMANILLVKHLEHKIQKPKLDASLRNIDFIEPDLFYDFLEGKRPFMHSPRLIDSTNISAWNELDSFAIPRLLASLSK